MRFIILINLLIKQSLSYTIAIAGAQGGLGRELVQQSLENKCQTVALVRRTEDPIYHPYRDGWLSENIKPINVITNDLLKIENIYDVSPECSPDALVIAIGGRPFTEDTSVAITEALLQKMNTTNKVCLVSAHGVSGKDDANIGITAMRNYYLKNVYAAKKRQEELVNKLPDHVDKLILRPRVLSYSRIPFNPVAVTRQALASDIIRWCLR